MTQVRPTYPGSGMNSPIRNEAWQESTEGLGIRDLGIFKVWEDNFEKLKTLVISMKPDQLESGSKHYQNLAKDMNGTVTLLHRVAQDMVKQWGGKDAQAALEAENARIGYLNALLELQAGSLVPLDGPLSAGRPQ